MTTAKRTGQPAAEGERPGREAAELELARQLAERARAEGLALTGPGGLPGRLTKVVLEGALEGELDAHLGYTKHVPAGATRPWPSVKQPTVRTDRDGAPIPSAYLHCRGDCKGFRSGSFRRFGACFTVLPCLDYCRFLRAGGRVQGREAPAERRRRRP